MAPQATRTAPRPAAPDRAPHPAGTRWWLALCGAVLVALTGSVAAGLWTPGRLFVPGGATVLVLSTNPIPPPGALNRAVVLLRERLDTAGYGRPSVRVTGPRTVTVRLDGHPDPDPVRELLVPGRVSFRTVAAGPADTGPAAGPPDGDPAPDLETLRHKLGTAYDKAVRLTDPSQVDDARTYAAFGLLRPEEVALLPPVMQFAVPTIACERLGGEETAGPIAACQPGTGKYLLDAATVRAEDVSGAEVVLDPYAGWSARVRFTPLGTAHWAGLVGTVRANPMFRRIAVVLDHRVIAVPAVEDAGTAQGLVTRRGLDQYGAQRLVAILDSGPLPVTFSAELADN
jgi:preprotein translocase subunit SecD